MKRVYNKPEIMFEDFSLSTNIANGCEFEASFSKGTCAAKVEEMGLTWNVFFSDIAACTTTAPGKEEDDNEFNGICYHVPVDTSNVFSS